MGGEGPQAQGGEDAADRDRALDGRQAEADREQGVEEHLVVERPAQLEHRADAAGVARIEMGNEQQRLHQAADGELAVPRQGRRDDQQGRGDEGHDPVERHDALDAPADEFAARHGRAPHRIEHHEAADHEEQVDTALADGAGDDAAERRDLLPGMLEHDQQRRDGAQILDGPE
jgi:hypothetical protein